MNKEHALSEIAEVIKKCRVCKIGKMGLSVPGEGNPDADVVFIGEAPGKTEAVTGRPFVGRSGKLLRSMIKESGLTEKEVYITSPVKYLPKRGTPTPKHIKHGMTHLSKQLAIIDPKIIVLMGSTASLGVLGEKVFVAKEHGSVRSKNGKQYFIMYHPAAAIRFTRIKAIFLKDFFELKSFLHKAGE